MKKMILAAMMVLTATQTLADTVYQPSPGRVVRPPLVIKPTKRALLVMIENGGYKEGLPFEIGNTNINQPTGNFVCGGHKVSVGNPGQMIQMIGNFIRSRGFSNDPCLNLTQISQRWSAEMRSVTLAQFIRSNTDFVIEGLSIQAIKTMTEPRYDKVIFLQNSQFSAEMALSVLNQYRTQYKFDIHTLAHGSKKSIVGGNSSEGQAERVNRANFFDKLRDQNALTNRKVYIRAVYQQNCFGSYLNDLWRDAGAEVVSGSKETNWMPLAYAGFLRRWLESERFDLAVMAGYNEQVPFIQVAMGFLGRLAQAQQMINDSYPLFSGDVSLRID